MPILLQPSVKSKDINQDLVRALANELNIVRPLAEVLYTRGYTDTGKLQKFLYTDRTVFSSPEKLEHLPDAVEIIKTAVSQKKKITVYGDYDVDGICATAILYLALKEMGADVSYYLPDRHSEGYGVNEEAVKSIAQDGTALLLTVDCGISSYKEVQTAAAYGLQVIVTDHHELPDLLPECPIINPKQSKDDGLFKELCGAGVALKLATALLGEERAEKYFDIAAIATIADIVPLTDENRYIVKKGLEMINARPREGIKQLILKSGIDHKTITSTDIAFMLAPRLNAAGRIAQAGCSLELFIHPEKAEQNAGILQEYNLKRQEIENTILQQAVQMAENSGQIRERRILVLASEGWDAGVIGIVASRMTERFNRPCIMLSINGTVATGSARSIKGIHLFNMLNEFKELFIKFGGHEMAAGMSLGTEYLDELLNSLDEYIKAEIDPKVFYPAARYDARVKLAEISLPLCEQMQLLEPFGAGNPVPKFRIDGLKAANTRLIGKNENHLKASLYDDITSIEAVAYNFANSNVFFDNQNSYSVVSTPMISTWNDVNSVILKINAVSKDRNLEAVKKQIEDEKDQITSAFFMQSMYNNTDNTGQNALMFDNADEFIDEMLNCLLEDISGTLVLASCPAVCTSIAEMVYNTSPRTDICFYKPTDGSNGYNTLLLAPGFESVHFCTYRNVFICDLYEPEYLNYIASLAPHAEFIVYSANAVEMFAKLDKKYTDFSRQTMGRIYKVIRQFAASDVHYKSLGKLKEAMMATDRYLDNCNIDFALAVFKELGFITVTNPPKVGVVMNNVSQQTELSKSTIYNKITKYLA